MSKIKQVEHGIDMIAGQQMLCRSTIVDAIRTHATDQAAILTLPTQGMDFSRPKRT